MKKMNEKELEQLIHTTLRSLPNRRAPGTLEARVLAALEHRSTVAWYHRSWSYWPAAVRVAFLTLASGAATLGLVAMYFVRQGVELSRVGHELAAQFPQVAEWYAAGTWFVSFANRFVTNLPALWLYGGLATVAALYATFFGVGAAAYRAFNRAS
ncbi:MAG TPA: hypothetical protein VHD32_13995 [Candidatus Didemnitutus sp.]|nr:hypothetical protein [Candidatus Didemnitutus sp.]